jgi:hypothetical protein
MLTFAAAVVGVAATVGCGDASVGEMPSPILTAPPRATMTATGQYTGSGALSGLTDAGTPVSGWVGTEIHELSAAGSNPAPTPDLLPPVPTAMVAAQAPANQGTKSGQSPGVEQWRPLVESIFPAFAVETVLRIMNCESSGNVNATGSAGEMGLMQIHPRWHPDATYDPIGNLRAAYRISGGGTSWGAWTCR